MKDSMKDYKLVLFLQMVTLPLAIGKRIILSDVMCSLRWTFVMMKQKVSLGVK